LGIAFFGRTGFLSIHDTFRYVSYQYYIYPLDFAYIGSSKLKPTIVNCLFAAILLGGLALGRPLLRPLLGQMLPMTDEGWKKLTLRWGLFFIVLAIINEVVWRNFSTDFWVSFKLFGIMPLTLVFSFAQMPLIRRYSTESAEDKNE
ncbi:MAG: septation protein IspZ, partial [Pseudomonadota bacterium]